MSRTHTRRADLQSTTGGALQTPGSSQNSPTAADRGYPSAQPGEGEENKGLPGRGSDLPHLVRGSGSEAPDKISRELRSTVSVPRMVKQSPRWSDGARKNLREPRPPRINQTLPNRFDITEPQLCYAWPAWRDPSDPQVATHRQGELLADNPPRQPPLVRALAHSATRWDSSPTQLYPGTIRQLQKEMLAPYRDITRPPLTFL